MHALREAWRQWMRRGGFTLATAAGLLTLLTACAVGPDYVRPMALAPAAYKEMNGWKVAQPQDTVIHGTWWEIFADPQLNALEAQVDVSNQNIAVAEAQFQQARALVREARASYFPTVTVGLGVTRARGVASTTGGASQTSGHETSRVTATAYSLPIDVSWELDVWGRIRRTVESNQASAQASAADLESVRLSFQAELAQDYIQLRSLDAQKQLLDATVMAFAKALELTQNRYASGVASRADVVQAETQLKTTQAQAIDIGVQRAQLEHAIAVLIGTPASDLSIPAAPLATGPPPIPVGVPSELLERRPDIAAAERRVAAANAQIGVAAAAFVPTVTLSASDGLESSSRSQWLMWPMRVWSVGGTLS
jgi:NodT family efflux transporter outer membrane factor (OMF) lipoprotein